MKFFLGILCIFWGVPVLAQLQACPVNINFNQGNLSNWTAETGIFLSGSDHDDSSSHIGKSIYPNWQSNITEYQLPSMNGVEVNTSSSTDYYGGFPTIPTINGYQYNFSVLLGSTAISKSNGNQGGYYRYVTYLINVPPGPSTVPYTMTYAYAMVLENGTHNSNQQPESKATLSVNGSIITCASPSYLLPTLNNAQGGGTGATLDSAAAIAEGFTPSRYPSVNANPNSPTGGHLYDVRPGASVDDPVGRHRPVVVGAVQGWYRISYRGADTSYRIAADLEAGADIPDGEIRVGEVSARGAVIRLEGEGYLLPTIG